MLRYKTPDASPLPRAARPWLLPVLGVVSCFFLMSSCARVMVAIHRGLMLASPSTSHTATRAARSGRNLEGPPHAHDAQVSRSDSFVAIGLFTIRTTRPGRSSRRPPSAGADRHDRALYGLALIWSAYRGHHRLVTGARRCDANEEFSAANKR